LADGFEHGVLIGGAGADVAGGERTVGHGTSGDMGRRRTGTTLASPRLSPAWDRLQSGLTWAVLVPESLKRGTCPFGAV
jgi:sirohydrochlorin ferrochelatase